MNDSENSKTYASRAGLKLEYACHKFRVNFKNKKVLDVGSSSGGFTDYALTHGASEVIAIELGTNQMASPLRLDKRIELHEKTNILDVSRYGTSTQGLSLSFIADIVMVDLSFVSLRAILPHLYKLVDNQSLNLVLVKPQFESRPEDKNRGIVKNETIRRQIFKDFESWVKGYFLVLDKVDSSLAGSKGNKERFYLLRKI